MDKIELLKAQTKELIEILENRKAFFERNPKERNYFYFCPLSICKARIHRKRLEIQENLREIEKNL